MSKEGTQDSSAVTNGVRIVVRSEYLDEESSPRMQRYVFSYAVRIHNEGAVTVQLTGRHWVIRDCMDKVEDVRGVNGRTFDAAIAPFSLIAPMTLN